MKLYACSFCKQWTDRKSARKCLMTHIKTDKDNRKMVKEARKGSNITERMLIKEVE